MDVHRSVSDMSEDRSYPPSNSDNNDMDVDDDYYSDVDTEEGGGDGDGDGGEERSTVADNDDTEDDNASSVADTPVTEHANKKTDELDDEDFDEGSDDEDSFDGDGEQDDSAAGKFFYNRLMEFLATYDPEEDVRHDWKVKAVGLCRGPAKGILDICYYNRKGRKYRTRVDVAMALNILPYTRAVRAMPRYMHAMLAVETRERFLISEILYSHPKPESIVEFIKDGDRIRARCSGESISTTPAKARSESFDVSMQLDDTERYQETPRNGEDGTPANIPHDPDGDGEKEFDKTNYYSYGNTTVLDWGRIIPSCHFHNHAHLFPLGFKCIRQEHDTILDRIVDCLCEIDCVSHSDPNCSRVSYDEMDTKARADLRPVFRITVAWEVGSRCRQVVRVYEGKTPQLVWQSVMLESVGLSGTIIDGGLSAKVPEDEDSVTDTEGGIGGIMATPVAAGPTEEMDDEERTLRSKLMEVRRLHMRALSSGQSNGTLNPVKPRLGLESVDSIMDVGILRMVEGMSGSEESAMYQFLDSRSSEPVKRVILKNLIDMNEKVKVLDKVASKNTSRLLLIEQERQRLQRRSDDVESRRKSREEQRQDRLKRMMTEQKRKLRAKELEKYVRTIRDEEMKAMNSRRIYSRLRLEILARQEEEIATMSKASNTPPSPQRETSNPPEKDLVLSNSSVSADRRPTDMKVLASPLGRPLHLGERIFGQSLELWLFLISFCKPLCLAGVPSQEGLENSLSACEPPTMHLQHMLKRARGAIGCTSIDSSPQIPSRSDAEALLSKVGMALCKPLMPEFNKIMTLESVEQFLGDNRVELNVLTWKEIARVLLTHTLCSQFGMSDFESMTTLRGRGHTTAPDIGDKRSLRLIRRRILFRYSQSIWKQTQGASTMVNCPARETLCPNMYTHLGREISSGLVVRLPTPSTFTKIPFRTSASVSTSTQIVLLWCELYYHLLQLGRYNDQEFFSSHVIIAAQMCVNLLEVYILETERGVEMYLTALKSLKNALSIKCSSGDHFHQLRSVLLLILHCLVKNSNISADRATIQCIQDISRVPVPHAYSIAYINEFLAKNDGSVGKGLYEWTGKDIAGRTVEMSSTMTDLCSLDAGWIGSVSPLMVHDTLMSRGWNPVALPIYDPRKKQKSSDDSSAGLSQESSDQSLKQEKNDSGEILSMSKSETTDSDQEKVNLLSAVTQRCYAMLKNLMSHPLSEQFNSPVDASTVVGYYDMIRNPLCLLDVREHLVTGKYGDSFVDFYRDVMLVFQNALAFNTDITQLSQSTMKLICVFERMFYECILNISTPIDRSDNCLVCRSTYENDGTRTVLCDRCDAPYHMDCLSPPMYAPPRGEWFCPCCVEERHVEHIHPLRNALVWNPSSPVNDREIGRVVGIVRKEGHKPKCKVGHVYTTAANSDTAGTRCEKETPCVAEDEGDITWFLQYHIEFGYSIEDIPHMSTNHVTGRGTARTVVWVLDDVLSYYYGNMESPDMTPNFKPASPPLLPTGYTYREYDAVAAMCRAYEGWVSFHSALPGCVDQTFSTRAHRLITTNDRVRVISRAASVISSRCGSFAMRSEDWVTVLLALSYKAIATPAFIENGHSMDEITTADYAEVLKNIGDSKPPTLLDYKNKLKVAIGDKLLFTDEVVEEEGEPVEDDENVVSEDEESVKEEMEIEENEKNDCSRDMINDEPEPDDGDTGSSSCDDIWDEELEAAAQSRGSVSDSDGFCTDVGEDGMEDSVTNETDISHDSDDSDFEDNLFTADELKAISDGKISDLENEQSHPKVESETSDNEKQNKPLDGNQDMPPPSCVPPVTDNPRTAIDELKHSWETRNRSNRRGKEDAMFALTLVEKIESELAQSEDVFRESDENEEVVSSSSPGGTQKGENNEVKDVRNCDKPTSLRLPSATVSYLAPGCILHTMVKATLPRPADDLDMKEWLTSFSDRFHDGAKEIISINSESSCETGETSSAMEMDGDMSTSKCSDLEPGTTCAWCGFTEKMLCSRFVYGPNWDEWIDWKQMAEKEKSEDSTEVPKKKVITSWLPVNKSDSAMLLEAVRLESSDDVAIDGVLSKIVHQPPKNIKVDIVKGSLVVHECCAESMHVARLVAYNKQVERKKEEERVKLQLKRQAEAQASTKVDVAEDRKLADVLCGIARGKVISLGYDRNGNVYYVFPGTRSLFVCTREEQNKAYIESEMSTNKVDSLDHHAVNKLTLSSLGKALTSEIPDHECSVHNMPDPIQPDSMCLKWKVFDSTADIAYIILSLDEDNGTEKTVKRALKVLYSDASDLSAKIEKNAQQTLYECGERTDNLYDLLLHSEEYLSLVRDYAVDMEGVDASAPVQVEDTTNTSCQQEEDVYEEVDIRDCTADENDEDDDEGEWDESDLPAENVLPVLREKRKRSSSPRASLEDSKRQHIQPTNDKSVTSSVETEPLYTAGSRVFILRKDKWWEGRVTGVRSRHFPDSEDGNVAMQYKVRFIGWGTEYDTWVEESSLLSYNQGTRAMVQEQKQETEERERLEGRGCGPDIVPEILKSLTAFKYYTLTGRHNTHTVGGVPLNYQPLPGHSSNNSDLAVLKSAMLMVHAALPYGSIDESEERWGRGVPGMGSGVILPTGYESSSFAAAWKYAVTSAADATQLMECQLMLEYGVRSSWFKTTGAKLMCCMPSRLYALRHPTLGMVATRLFCLDQAVKYDKVKTDDEPLYDDELDRDRPKVQKKKGSKSKSRKK